jgi:hypothetical protein
MPETRSAPVTACATRVKALSSAMSTQEARGKPDSDQVADDDVGNFD